MISGDAQIYMYIDTNRRGKRKAILGPAGHARSLWPADKNGWQKKTNGDNYTHTTAGGLLFCVPKLTKAKRAVRVCVSPLNISKVTTQIIP